MKRTQLTTIACLTARMVLAPHFSSADPEGQVFNPKAYGAVGDGVADDTAAFASVVAAATPARGIVQIPAGTYLATVAVTKGGIAIQGAGKEATIIKAPNTAAASAAGRVVVVAESDRTTIKDLTIDGNKSARSGKKPIVYSLLLYRSSDCVVENVRVIDSEQIGLGLSTTKRARVSRCEVNGSGWQNITTLNNKAGGCEGTVISNCRAINPGFDDIQITNVGAVTVENCYVAEGPFAGIYVATGARNVTLKNNTITKCYTGIDTSWGAAGGGNGGPDRSEGDVIVGNHVTRCENIGIGTASNGTVITNNSVSDIGVGAATTYTLLGQRTTIASGGSGYTVGDILTFIGGRYLKPAEVQVTAVGAGGTVTSITLPSRFTSYYLGVYSATPANPISVSGGTGSGATFDTTWNARALKYSGIAVVDAGNVTITNNTSGNSAGNNGQRYGVALLRQFTSPSHVTISGNTLSGNAVASVSPVLKASGRER
jgi:hypothetical protein